MAFDRPGFDKEVGLRLRLARKRRGVTQADIAAKIGVPRATYANMESGRQRIPVDILWRAAVVLSVSISALVPEPLNVRSPHEPLLPFSDALFGKPAAASESPTAMTSLYFGTSTSFPVLHDGGGPMPWARNKAISEGSSEEEPS
jgi:transcriptional regulator with XRE-family HTH domain